MPAERILVVDDEDAIREIVTAMLQSSGYRCQQAASGLQALALLNSGEPFELVLSDLMMAETAFIRILSYVLEFKRAVLLRSRENATVLFINKMPSWTTLPMSKHPSKRSFKGNTDE